MIAVSNVPPNVPHAAFPQYGWKPVPPTCPPVRYKFCASCGLLRFLLFAACNGSSFYPGRRCAEAPVQADVPLSSGSSFRSGLCCPGPSALNGPMRPTPRRSSISPTPLIRDVLAVRHRARPRRPESGSVLSLAILSHMSSSETTGSPSVAFTQFLRRWHAGLRPECRWSRHSKIPTLRFSSGRVFEAYHYVRFRCYDLPICSPPCRS